ncbi:unnamed protein product [Symbiodinium natans]|uniref:Uncharacterized protein n=1 Tax=Symbiodinium natans TaxID=878477 RepID=A0A812L6H0_9DINO|nr:unnamed protein product [Symbiodinium natans]
MAGWTVNPRSSASKRDKLMLTDVMPANLRTTTRGSAPRFGRVNCLDAQAFAQLCARLDPMPGNPGELSEGLPVCRAPAMKEPPPMECKRAWTSRTSRTCWDDDEDLPPAGVLPEVCTEKPKTWRVKASRQRAL